MPEQDLHSIEGAFSPAQVSAAVPFDADTVSTLREEVRAPMSAGLRSGTAGRSRTPRSWVAGEEREGRPGVTRQGPPARPLLAGLPWRLAGLATSQCQD